MKSPFSVILAVMMFFMPESPYYLLLKGREEDARKALQWLRGKDYDIDQEMEEMKKTQEVICGVLRKFSRELNYKIPARSKALK